MSKFERFYIISAIEITLKRVEADVSPAQDSPQPAWLPLHPRQRVEIDVAAGENDPDALSSGVDLAFNDRGVRNGR